MSISVRNDFSGRARPPGASMQYRVLGPIEVEDAGRPLALRGVKQRALLGIFLLHPNEVLAPDRLLEELWSGNPPDTGRTALAMRIWRLRKLLGEGGRALETYPNGYLLHVEPDSVDLYRFEARLSDGDRSLKAGAFAAAAQTLRQALDLWRGRPFEELTYEPFAQSEIERIEEERLLALEERIEAELALGQGAKLVSELELLVREYPLCERFRSQLMLALYRSGRQAEALTLYQDTRRILREELGLDPSVALQDMQQAILRQDTKLEVDVAQVQRRGSTAMRRGRSGRAAMHLSWSCWCAR
jgi:DNA-binding SARP family transcriptional activator